MSQPRRGTLYLVPASLGESPLRSTLPEAVAEQARRLQHFVVENAKTARADLKRIDHPTALRELSIVELPRNAAPQALADLLAPALDGKDIGLMSEAGVPAVADPGASLVRSQVLLRLTVSPEAPACMLALASRDPAMFEDGMPTDLIAFLARVLERSIRRWLDLPQ